MKWTVYFPRKIAEETSRELKETVEADNVEEAIQKAVMRRRGYSPSAGESFEVRTRVEIAKPRGAFYLRDVRP